MRSLWRNLRELSRPTPMRRGIYEAAGLMGILSALFALIAWRFFSTHPSAEFLQALAQVGATILVAYALETSWLVKASRARPLAEREDRLGALIGVGASALIAIAVALVLAGRAETSDWAWLDQVGLGFAIGPIAMAGVMVALQPLVTHEWLDDDGRPATETED